MKIILKHFSLLIILLLPASLWATEYQVKPQHLLTFSGSQVQAKMCDACDVVVFDVVAETEFYYKNSKIDLTQASELYLKKNFPRVSLHTLGDNKELLFIIFGIAEEVPPPAQNTPVQEDLK